MDSSIIDPELREEFKRDFLDQLQEVERLLLKLELDPSNMDHIRNVFRPFHTIKGNAGVIGEVEIQDISQLSENILDQVRQGKRKLSESMIEVVFESVDLIRVIVEKGNPQNLSTQIDALKEKLSSAAVDSGKIKKRIHSSKIHELILDRQVAEGVLVQLSSLDKKINQCKISRDFEPFLFDIFDNILALSSYFEENISLPNISSRIQYLEMYLTVLNTNDISYSIEAWSLLKQITSEIVKTMYPVLVDSFNIGICYFNPNDSVEDLNDTLNWLCEQGKQAIMININKTNPPLIDEIKSLIRIKKSSNVPIAYIQRFFGHKQHWKDMELLMDDKLKIESSFWRALESFV